MNSKPSNDAWLGEIAWNEQGLAPAIAQDAQTGQVLMMAWMNREALAKTADIGEAVYWSRSRQRLWHKGESSGHTQKISEIRLDCDADAILLSVSQTGGIACHTGREHCFYRQFTGEGWRTVDQVVKDPSEIYSEKS